MGYTPDQFSSLDVEILFGTEASLDEIFDSLDSNKDSEVRFASKCFLPTASYLNCCRSSQLKLVSSYNVRRSNEIILFVWLAAVSSQNDLY